MNSHLDRVHHFKGSPYQIGFDAGHLLGNKLERTINHYIASRKNSSDTEKLHEGALPWLRKLPQRFQDEIQGIVEGANISIQKYAEWMYIEECEAKQCSGAVYLSNNQA